MQWLVLAPPLPKGFDTIVPTGPLAVSATIVLVVLPQGPPKMRRIALSSHLLECFVVG